MKAFADKWMWVKTVPTLLIFSYSIGCPHFTCGFWLNKAAYHTEVALKQELAPLPGTLASKFHRPKLVGTLTLRVVMAENSEEVCDRHTSPLGAHPHQDLHYVENPLNFDSEMHLYNLQVPSKAGRRRGGPQVKFLGIKDDFTPTSPAYGSPFPGSIPPLPSLTL